MVIALQVSLQPPGASTSPVTAPPNTSGNFRLIPACLKADSDFEHILTINITNSSQYFSGRVIMQLLFMLYRMFIGEDKQWQDEQDC